MDSKQTLKAILQGFCLGLGLTWLLALILPLIAGLDAPKFIHDCYEDIFSLSIFGGVIGAVIWMILAALSHKRRKREELEDAMAEYFKNLNEKE